MSRAVKVVAALALIVLAYRRYARTDAGPVEYDADPVYDAESAEPTA